MKMSKLEGLKMLKMLDFPTIEQIDPNLLDENSQVLKQGLSVRTSPKRDRETNVYLPSIHNCKDLKQLRTFIEENKDEYNIIVHKTVQPEKIGSVSRYENYVETEKLAIEIFEDFEKRKNGIIKNSVVLPVIGDRFMVSQLQMKEENKEEFQLFSKVLRDVKELPFKKFDAEFVIENGKVLFTDLTIQGREDKKYAEELEKSDKQKMNSNRFTSKEM